MRVSLTLRIFNNEIQPKITVNKEFILNKIEQCTDFYANEESNTLKELSDDMLEGYLEDCLSYVLICYSSICMTVRGVWVCV